MNEVLPSKEDIRKAFEEIVPKLKALKTKEDVVKFGIEHQVTMEINSNFAEFFNEADNEIEYIRMEAYKCLNYIYIFRDGQNENVYFDVWCGLFSTDFLCDISLKNLDDAYVDGIKWLYERMTKSGKEYELIGEMRNNGITYEEMVSVYGFDNEVINAYEAAVTLQRTSLSETDQREIIEHKVTEIMLRLTGSEYAKRILMQEDEWTGNTFLEEVTQDVIDSPASQNGYFNEDAIRLAIGKELVARLDA